MKKITFLTVFLFTLFSISSSFGQKVVIVGMNHISSGAPNDGFTFVATEPIPAGEVIYFTENEYDDAANAFTFNGAPTGEAVIRYVVGAGGLATGVVVFMHETSSNAFTITCSSGSCGTSTTSVLFGNGSFNLATNGDGLYAYSDTDENVVNGVTQIYSAMYTGSGEAPTQNGGNIPANNNPTGDYPLAVMVDGFPDDGDVFLGPQRVEYMFSPASLRDAVSQTALENPTNYLSYASNVDLSIVPFTNLNLGGANPILTVAASPTSVNENSGTGMVYTFTLDAAAVGAIPISFSVGGTASGADYAQTGTATIPNGGTTAMLTFTPVGDTTLEPDETVIITILAGAGYDAGSPSIATGTILNDDTLGVTPVVAVTGGVHAGGTEGFSFVALDDITAGTEVFFTENVFNNNLLRFTGAEGVVRWTAPAGGVLRGEVIVATEGPANVFTTTCDSGTCGTVTLISGIFDYASNGEAMFAYTDSDTDHTNGITAISSVLFTGTSVVPGGNIPAIEDPSGIYIGSVVVDGFPAVPAVRTEYRFALGERGVTVDQANFQNTSNWLHAAPAATLNTTPFANIIIATGSANPNLTLTVVPSSSVEDSGVGMVYTFLLDAAAVGNITVNFTVAGTATFTTDYTQTGAATFAAGSGTAVILNGNTSVDVTITPVVDVVVEPAETVGLMIASGTGYDGGSPNSATGSITNDDTSDSDPLVAITGMNHVTPDGFSFVAAKDIPASTLIYFTENEFNNTSLLFTTGEAVLAYTSPGAIVPAGDVIVIKETAPNVFSLTCNGNTGAPCGSIVLVSGNLAHDTLGESLYAYEDSDNDPSNGVDDIYAVMFTGLSGGPSGGTIPASQDPSGIYLSALVIDGFPATAPSRTEYRFALGERGIPVGVADFENTAANWLHGQSNADLSAVPFTVITILDTTPPVITCPTDVTVECGGDTTPAGTGTATAIDDIDPTPIITFADTSVVGCGLTEVITRTWTATDNVGNSSSCVQLITTVDTTDPTVTAPANATVECGGDTSPAGTGSPTGGDGCGSVAITFADSSAAGCGLTETITRTFTATDQCGNTAQAVQTITVVDTTLPTITCPPDITVGNDAGLCSAVVTYTPPVGSDTCGASTTILLAGLGSGATFPVGNTTETYEVTDACGNVETCSFVVTVNDTETPVVTCPADITVSNDAGSCSAIVTFSPTTTDNCPGVTTSSVPASGSVFPVGTTLVTVTGTDASGNTSSCTFNVTVNDTEAPVVTCPADITVSNDAGVCGAIVNFSPTVSDNCAGATASSVPASGSVFPVGTTLVTVTGTDASGNTSSCTFNVTVNDMEAPVITCPADITVSNDPGQCDAVVTFSPTATDNCPGVTSSSVPASGTVFPVGTTLVTVTATDASGNTSSCTFNVTVNDTEAPVVTCPADITVNNIPGQCDAVVTFSSTTTDNCPGVTTSSVPASGSTFPVGTTLVTVTATDATGNTSSCTFNVTVNDTEPPVITCPADIIVSNDPGLCSADVCLPTAIGTDNCGTVVITNDAAVNGILYASSNNGDIVSLDLTTGVGTPIGNANSGSGMTEIEYDLVNDKTYAQASNGSFSNYEIDLNTGTFVGPVVPNAGSYNGLEYVGGTLYGTVIYGGGGSSPSELRTLDPTTGISSLIGLTGVGPISGLAFDTGLGIMYGMAGGPGPATLYTIDLSTGIATPVGVSTIQSGSLQFGPNGVLYAGGTGADAGNLFSIDTATGASSLIGATGLTNVTGLTLSGSGCIANFPIGVTTVTYTATDGSGNTSSCTMTVTVNDTEAPVITCPADIIVSNDPGQCDAVVTFMATATDNCPGVTSSSVPASGSVFPIGTTLVTVTATDAAGNTDVCTFNVTVNDDEDPVVTCPSDIIVSNDPGLCDAVVTFTPTATDNCTGTTISSVPASGSIFPLGTTTVTVTATDASGNTNVCTFDVTVNDDEDPVVVCPADIIVSNDPGLCDAVVTFTPTATDNCSGVIITSVPPSGSVFPVGTTTVTVTATDASGGSGGPITSAANTAILALGNGNDGEAIAYNPVDGFMYHASGISPGSQFFEPIDLDALTIGANLAPGDTWPAGLTQEVTGMVYYPPMNGFVVMDRSNNIALVDPVTAIFSSLSTFVGSGSFGYIRGFAVVGTSIYGVEPGSGNLVEFDPNTGAVVTTVPVVMDGVAITAGSNSLTTDPSSGDVYIIYKSGGPNRSLGIIDVTTGIGTGIGVTGVNFAGLSFDSSGNLYAVSGDGASPPETLFQFDESTGSGTGNTDVCTFTITVNDDEAPVVTCPADIIVSNDPGLCDAVVTFAPTATDNCPGVTFSSVPASGSIFPVGTTLVTITATDAAGNTDVCTFNVTVNDDENPVVICPADIIVSNDPGQCDAVVTFTPLAFDNCPGVTVSSVPASGSVFPIGTTLVTVTGTDVSGNTSSCTFNVTVNDDEDPVVTCPADITVSNDAGLCSAIVTFTPTISDNCAGATFVSVPASGSVFPVGTTLVTVTATDAAGNTNVCTFNVTVNDDEDPVVTCPADITVSNDVGSCDAVVTFTPTISDNCAGATFVSVPASGSVFPVGTTLVTVTGTDAVGNTNVCTFNVTVNDDEAPVVTCPADIIVSNDSGFCDAVVTFTPTATDNCAGVTVSSVPASGSVFPVGTTTVTVTATDAAGNTDVCTFDVTVDDDEDPIVTCPADIIVSNDLGECGAVVDFTPIATDNCSGTTISSVPASGSLFPLGTTTVTVTATDAAGNIVVCTFDVTVNDDEEPVLTCPEDIVVGNDLGQCYYVIVGDEFDPITTDNCTSLTVTNDINGTSSLGGEKFLLGDTMVTWTADDGNGNVLTCTATITVEDTEAPELTCPEDQTHFLEEGETLWEVPDFFAIGEASAEDNCTESDMLYITQVPEAGTLLPEGVYTVTIDAKDEAGNFSTCTFELTIEPLLGVGDNELTIENIILYPNPSKDYVIIGNPQSLLLNKAVIYDLNDRLIRTIDLRTMGTEMTIDVSRLAAASYNIIIYGDQGSIIKRMIKE